MVIVPVGEILAPAGLSVPSFNALVPDIANYTVLLMQPSGNIDAGPAGVRNRDRALAKAQYGQFLAAAHKSQVDLAVTPEYSMSWELLVKAVKGSIVPAEGKLWAFGCESIHFQELTALKESLGASATVLFEQLNTQADRFTDPLVYIFKASVAGEPNNKKIVMLVQFKTHPMGDHDHFEINSLQLGTANLQVWGAGRDDQPYFAHLL